MADRTKDEIDDVLSDVLVQIGEGGSRFPGMTYEEGVQAALQWVIGDTEEHPYPED